MLSMKMAMLQLEVEGRSISIVGFDEEGAARAFVDARIGLVLVLGDCDHPTPFWAASVMDAQALCAGGYELACGYELAHEGVSAPRPMGIRRVLN